MLLTLRRTRGSEYLSGAATCCVPTSVPNDQSPRIVALVGPVYAESCTWVSEKTTLTGSSVNKRVNQPGGLSGIEDPAGSCRKGSGQEAGPDLAPLLSDT